MENSPKTTVKPQLKFKDQLEQLGIDFALAMEKFREAHFGDMFRYLVHIYGLDHELEIMNDNEQKQFIDMCKLMHNYGFYGGISFTLDPDKEYEPHVIYED